MSICINVSNCPLAAGDKFLGGLTHAVGVPSTLVPAVLPYKYYS